jgi:NAD-dependent SIR2 family protein deacetylase
MDTPEVFAAKVKVVADLIRRSRHCCAYTGAGLSKASGIPDYATKAKDSVVAGPKIKSSLDALPTYAHHALVAMHDAGCLHSWVQQNHDGLPQKASFPQEKINEIHGAWFDPSNPVVPFSGNLRSDLFNWMLRLEQEVDLCLCLGTSLSGMNADRMARTPAEKALVSQSRSLGTVIVNLQKTPLDDASSIRVWSKLDEFFKALSTELGIAVDPKKQQLKPITGTVFVVPYNAKGQLDPTCRMTLDLSPGAAVRIAPKEAPNFGAVGKVRHRDRHGHWVVEVDKVRTLGSWYVTDALEGKLEQLPLVNDKPKIQKVTDGSNDALVASLQSRNDAGVAALVDMGFDAEVALNALKKCRGDLHAATVLLTEGEGAEL